MSTLLDKLGLDTELAYCCTHVDLIASAVLICESLWIKASAKLLNVNVTFFKHLE